MFDAKSHILSELSRFNAKKMENRHIWVCCPFHNEKTPSCRITLVPGKFPVGSFYCFGCAEGGGWKKFAEKANLSDFTGKSELKVTADTNQSKAIKEKLLPTKERRGSKKQKQKLNMAEWRSIDAKILEEIGCRVIQPSNIPFLFIPVHVQGNHVTNITARFKKHKKFPSYLMDKDEMMPTKTYGLFPYDYAERMLKRQRTWDGKKRKFTGLCLVEGPRDALRLIQEGIPAIALLGTHSWSKAKARMLKILSVIYDVDIVVMMDGDKAGKKAQKQVLGTIKELQIPHKKVNLCKWAEHYKMDSLDPMDAPEDLLDKIRQLVTA